MIELTPDQQTTIKHLRELADHAEQWTKPFNMRDYKTRPDQIESDASELLHRSDDVTEPECGFCCCLIGIADAAGMGADIDGYGFADYADKLFPGLYEDWCHFPDSDLFGAHLVSDLPTRVKGLRMAADMLESTGKIDESKLPD